MAKKKQKVSTQVFHFEGEKWELPIIEGNKDVFISYRSSNAPYVSRLFKELDDHEIKAWFDKHELHQDVGEEYTQRIHQGIDYLAELPAKIKEKQEKKKESKKHNKKAVKH